MLPYLRDLLSVTLSPSTQGLRVMHGSSWAWSVKRALRESPAIVSFVGAHPPLVVANTGILSIASPFAPRPAAHLESARLFRILYWTTY